MKKYKNAIFLFHRDLRIIDNIGLNACNDSCQYIYPVFIFTPEQLQNKKNAFKSENAVQFMIQSLVDVEYSIHKMGGQLFLFYGENITILKKLISFWNIDAIYCNMDYTPYAIKRDNSIVKELNIPVHMFHDYCLNPPGSILNGNGSPYQKFTPYYDKCLHLQTRRVQPPSKQRHISFMKSHTNGNLVTFVLTLKDALKRFTKENDKLNGIGGRENAIKQIKKAKKDIIHYSKTHNLLDYNTSQLSAYIKFGCISIREVYFVFHKNKDFIRQLIWRDFYATILYFYPNVYGSAMKPNYNKIQWHTNNHWFEKWCQGNTGFPIVDAGMRQLNITGYMHNRARLIVASFLVKTLLISWEKGEKYFAQKLIDYDPASNNGNWQWVAGSGADSQPYFRIFNPWEQTRNYDPECKYILSWVPELKMIPIKDILHWEKIWKKYIKTILYPPPMVDYQTQKILALKMYKKIFHS